MSSFASRPLGRLVAPLAAPRSFAAPPLSRAAFATSVARRKSATDSVKAGLKSVDRAVSDNILIPGLDAAEKAKGKAGKLKGEAKAGAEKLEGEAKARAEKMGGQAKNLEGRAKAEAERLEGEAKGVAHNAANKARDTAEKTKKKL